MEVLVKSWLSCLLSANKLGEIYLWKYYYKYWYFFASYRYCVYTQSSASLTLIEWKPLIDTCSQITILFLSNNTANRTKIYKLTFDQGKMVITFTPFVDDCSVRLCLDKISWIALFRRNLSDIDRDGKLSLEEFFIALHLARFSKQGK